jgi:hypothetical protein
MKLRQIPSASAITTMHTTGSVRSGVLGGRMVYGGQLESDGLPPTLVAVDAESGDVLQDRRTMSSADAGAMPVTTTDSDYRDVGGVRVPTATWSPPI